MPREFDLEERCRTQQYALQEAYEQSLFPREDRISRCDACDAWGEWGEQGREDWLQIHATSPW